MTKKLNESKVAKVEENFLQENPDKEFVDVNAKIITEKVPVPKMVKGIFINQRDPGAALQFPYKTKTHPLKIYTLYHGCEHEIPEEVADHLEGVRENDPWACHSRKYKMKEKPDGSLEPVEDSYVSYFQFKRKRAA